MTYSQSYCKGILLNIIKSDRITILPIINKNKQNSLNQYMNQIFLAKNHISQLLSQDINFQYLLFSNDKEDKIKLSSYYLNLDYPIFTQWELQKFVNSDLIDKEKNRIEQFFKNWKPRFQIYRNKRRENTNTKLSKLMILMAKNYFYDGYFTKKIEEIFLANPKYLQNMELIQRYVDRNINNFKYHRKPIDYTTSSIIKCEQRILGYGTPRIIKNDSNTLYKYWLCFDYIDENLKKQKMNLPLAYNKNYHLDFKQYNKSLSTNKFLNRKKKFKSKDLTKIKFTTLIPNKSKILLEQEKVKPLSFVNLNKSKHKSIINNIDNISVLFEREIQISMSKCKKRLTLTLSKELDKSIEPISITNNNIIGIDIGGSIENTLVNSNGDIVSFTHLDNLIKKLEEIDELPSETSEEKLFLLSECNKQSIACKKGKLLSKISRINQYYINNIIKDYLNNCIKNDIKHLVFEKLDRWSVKWNIDKRTNQKYNRVFQLLRQDGLVELFKKQARNKNVFVHTIPSYYTSQMCSCCHKIEKNNFKDNRKYICECGNNLDRDENAAKNMIYILERFSSMLCKQNSYLEYESIKFITKEFTKQVLLEEKVKNFSSKSCT